MRNELTLLEKIDLYLDNLLSEQDRANFEGEIALSEEIQHTIETQKLIRQVVFRNGLKAQIKQFAPQTISSTSFWNQFKYPIIFTILAVVAGISYTFYSLNKENRPESIGQTEASSNDGSTSINQQQKSGLNPNPSKSTAQINDTSTVENTISQTIHPEKHSTEIKKSEIDLKNFNQRAISNNNYSSIAQSELIFSNCDSDGLKTWVKPYVQNFLVQPSSGKTIECQDGTLVIVPQNAFVDSRGQIVTETVQLQVIEALNVADMLAYNLTTTTEGKTLQSGGMLYIQPLLNGEKLKIAPGKALHIEIPTRSKNSEMLAWKGLVDANGNINWSNPKELEKFLVPVDQTTLNFLPEGFSSTVEVGLPYKNHKTINEKLVDSLYYSLATEMHFTSENNNDKLEVISPREMEIPIKVGSDISYLIDGTPKSKLSYEKLKLTNISPEELKKVSIYISGGGKATWSSSVYYNIDGTVYIPSDRTNFILFVQNECNNIFQQKIDLPKNESIEYIAPKCNESQFCFINPSNIRTIRDNSFSNSYIHTKEFEARLKELHKLKNGQQFLDLYIANLSKNLHETDQIIADQLSGKEKDIFQQFAKEKLTNVDNKNLNQKALIDYYNSSRKKYQEEAQLLNEGYKKMNNDRLNSLLAEYGMINSTTKDSRVKKQARESLLFNLNKPSVANTQSYKVSWNNVGWINIDAYLHLLNKGERIVNISTSETRSGTRVYQCINFLKTVIPLNMIENKYEAHFPNQSIPEASSMEDTYCVGISKNGNELYYSEKKYNPYQNKSVNLQWETISETLLHERLRQLSPMNDVLIEALEKEKKQLEKEIERRKKEIEFQAKLAAIQAEIEKENAFIQSLIDAINNCKDNPEMESEIGI